MRSSPRSGSLLLFVLSGCGDTTTGPPPDNLPPLGVDGQPPLGVDGLLPPGPYASSDVVFEAVPTSATDYVGVAPVIETPIEVVVATSSSPAVEVAASMSPQVEVVASVAPESPPRVIRVKAVPMWDAPVGTEPEPAPAPTEPETPPVESHTEHTLQQEVQEKVQQVNEVNTEALEILNAIRKKKGLTPLPPDPIEKDPPPNEPMPAPSKE